MPHASVASSVDMEVRAGGGEATVRGVELSGAPRATPRPAKAR